MGFTDWIRNRQANRQQSVAQNTQEQKPETAKQMYNREAAQEEANRKPIEPQISEPHKVETRAAAELFDKVVRQPQGQGAPAQTPIPSDASGSPEAVRQKATNQDKSAAALSPTSAQKGTPETEKQTPAPSTTPSKQPDSSPQRPQTLPRTRPSWEISR